MTAIDALAEEVWADAVDKARFQLDVMFSIHGEVPARDREAMEAGISAGITAAVLVLNERGWIKGTP